MKLARRQPPRSAATNAIGSTLDQTDQGTTITHDHRPRAQIVEDVVVAQVARRSFDEASVGAGVARGPVPALALIGARKAATLHLQCIPKEPVHGGTLRR
jgi:hypothetical protein